jgi:hypothetical protein
VWCCLQWSSKYIDTILVTCPAGLFYDIDWDSESFYYIHSWTAQDHTKTGPEKTGEGN